MYTPVLNDNKTVDKITKCNGVIAPNFLAKHQIILGARANGCGTDKKEICGA